MVLTGLFELLPGRYTTCRLSPGEVWDH